MAGSTRKTLEQEALLLKQNALTASFPHLSSHGTLCECSLTCCPLTLDSPTRLVLKSASRHMKASCPRLTSLPSGKWNVFWIEDPEAFDISISQSNATQLCFSFRFRTYSRSAAEQGRPKSRDMQGATLESGHRKVAPLLDSHCVHTTPSAWSWPGYGPGFVRAEHEEGNLPPQKAQTWVSSALPKMQPCCVWCLWGLQNPIHIYYLGILNHPLPPTVEQSLYCKQVLLSLANKRADWPIAGQQVEVKQDSQTKIKKKKKESKGEEAGSLRSHEEL